MPASRPLRHRGRGLACRRPALRGSPAEQVRVPARHHPHHPAGQPAGQRHRQHQRHQPGPPARLPGSGRLVGRHRPGASPPRPAIGPVIPVAGSRPPYLGSRHRPPNRLRGPRDLQRVPDRWRRGSLRRSLNVPEHVPTRLQGRRSLRRPSRRVQIPVPGISSRRFRRPPRRPRRRRLWVPARRLTRRNDRGRFGGPPAGSVHMTLRIATMWRGYGPLRCQWWRRVEVPAHPNAPGRPTSHHHQWVARRPRRRLGPRRPSGRRPGP
jgi:hypothetical protein